jgi:hypothetical protein
MPDPSSKRGRRRPVGSSRSELKKFSTSWCHLEDPGSNLAQAKVLQRLMALLRPIHYICTPFCALVSKLGRKTPSRLRAWSLMRNEQTNCSLWEYCDATVKSEAISFARRCQLSRLTGWRTRRRRIRIRWAQEEEERHKGSLTKKIVRRVNRVVHTAICKICT